jgi:acarbose 7IV-phosphotransferase
MSRIFVSGLINLEVTLRVDGFPILYAPVRYPFRGVRSSVSGVGFNVAKALATLGNDVHFASMVGGDFAGEFAKGALKRAGISPEFVVGTMDANPALRDSVRQGGAATNQRRPERHPGARVSQRFF